jgi:hypothetical protein
MKLETKLAAYELLIADFEAKLQKAHNRIDEKDGEEVAITNILLDEVLRLSDYSTLLGVAIKIDKKVFAGKCNYEDFVESNYCPEIAA